MSTFFENVPVWVAPLFVLLLILGLRASRTRRVPLVLLCALPLLGILTFQNIVSLSAEAWIWLVAACVYALGVLIGAQLQQRWIITREARFVHVKGEWVTMAAIMVIFCASFAKGTIEAVAPTLSATTLFAVLFTAIVCLPAGHFLGRAIAAMRAPCKAA